MSLSVGGFVRRGDHIVGMGRYDALPGLELEEIVALLAVKQAADRVVIALQVSGLPAAAAGSI